MKVDARISSRLAELVQLGQDVLSTRRSPPGNVIRDDSVDSQLAQQWSTSVQSLLAGVFGNDSEHYKNFARFAEKYLSYSPVNEAFGVLRAAQDDFDHGHLYQLRRLVEAEVFDDFLEQADHLFQTGYHQAAAVVAGCVLEDGLRKLCEQRGVSLPQRPKLDQMNAELAKIGCYNKLTQKRVTTLADLRNKAAHGEWDEFAQSDVAEMLAAVRKFMEEFLA